MAIYYCINDVIDALEAADDKAGFKTLIPVKLEPLDCHGHREDAFMLSSTPKLLDLRENNAADQLAQLLQQVPLYNINLELILDEALAERHRNPQIEKALGAAFGDQPLPNTLKPQQGGPEAMGGGLRHPMLGHMDRTELAGIYLGFLKKLERHREHYEFERNILGKHAKRFAELYDGFITDRDGKVKAEILLAFGQRLDHDPGQPLESHTKNGEKQAQKMRIEDPVEAIWAWMEADNHQKRRCRDLHRVFQLQGLPRTPNWVRTDIFSLLEKEAMKQVFSHSLNGVTVEALEHAPALERALRNNAAGQVDDCLQQLLAQTLSPGTAYAGAAERFVTQAEKRAAEATRAGLL